MTIFSLTTPKYAASAAPAEIPLTADSFHVDPEDCECLIIDSPAVVEAFAKAVGCDLCEFEDVVTLDVDPWSDSVPCMSAEATEYSWAWFNSDGYWIAEVALTDEEINLVLLAAYPVLERPEYADAFTAALEIERWKSQQILKGADRGCLNALLCAESVFK